MILRGKSNKVYTNHFTIFNLALERKLKNKFLYRDFSHEKCNKRHIIVKISNI